MDGGSRHLSGSEACIGPNAILQLIAVLDPAEARQMLVLAGVAAPPPDSGMIPEGQAAAAHHAVRQMFAPRADDVLRRAGLATGDYILTHRIPGFAKALIRALPAPLGARLLTAAIGKHAWTFVGSGSFRVASRHPLTFEVARNPLVAGERSDHPLCHWHRAVFERLFAQLVWPGVVVREVACSACGAAACRFEIMPRPQELSE